MSPYVTVCSMLIDVFFVLSNLVLSVGCTEISQAARKKLDAVVLDKTEGQK